MESGCIWSTTCIFICLDNPHACTIIGAMSIMRIPMDQGARIEFSLKNEGKKLMNMCNIQTVHPTCSGVSLDNVTIIVGGTSSP